MSLECQAADVLFVLLSTLRAHNLDIGDVLLHFADKCDKILSGARTFPAEDV